MNNHSATRRRRDRGRNKVHHVYAKCTGRYALHLEVEFSGTLNECRAFVRAKVKQGRPTQFNQISRLPHDAASRRYLP